MKTYIEWHYDEPPREDGFYFCAVEYIKGTGESGGTWIEVFRWDRRAKKWETGLGENIPANWRIYAWGYKHTAVPVVDPLA